MHLHILVLCEVETVLLKPLLLSSFHPELIHLRELSPELRMLIHIDQTHSSSQFRHCISHRFNEIPPEPRHTKNRVITECELKSEEKRECFKNSLLLPLLNLANLFVSLVKEVYLLFQVLPQTLGLEYFLADHEVLE